MSDTLSGLADAKQVFMWITSQKEPFQIGNEHCGDFEPTAGILRLKELCPLPLFVDSFVDVQVPYGLSAIDVANAAAQRFGSTQAEDGQHRGGQCQAGALFFKTAQPG